MTIEDKIRDEKQYDTNREEAKISALSSGKLINTHILQVKKYYLLMEDKWTNNRHARFIYPPLGKALKKQTEKQAGALKFLNPSYEKGELKQTEGILPQNLMNDLIRPKLKEIVNLKDIIKTDEHIMNQNVEKFIIFLNILYL